MEVERLRITDRQQWLGWRKQDITASDIPAICGQSQYKSGLQVWCEKSGIVPEAKETDVMRAGRYLEAAVVDYLIERHPTWRIERPGFYLRAPKHRLGATPDAIAHDDHDNLVNIQIKTAGRRQFDEWAGEPPLSYQLQTLCEAMLLDAAYSLLVVMTREYAPQFYEYRIERNAAAEQRVLEMTRAFWESIEQGQTPAIDFSRDAELVRRLKPPKPELEAIEIANDNRWPGLLEQHESLKAEQKTIAEQIEALRAEIIAKLNGAPVATCQGWRIKHFVQERHFKAQEAQTKQFVMLSVIRESHPST